MSIPERKLLMNSFFISQFSYCLLVWMYQSRLTNNKINRLHEKCLCIVYSDKTSSFKELLDKDGSVNILTAELFKVYRNLSPNIVAEIFRTLLNNYNFFEAFLIFFLYFTFLLSITGLRVYPT